MSATVEARTPDGSMPVRRLTHRRLAEARARAGGYFWLPCPLCGQMTGGHEAHENGHASIPNPEGGRGSFTLVCPACAEAHVHVAWKVVAPPGHLVHYTQAELDGPLGWLARARLGLPLPEPGPEP